MGSDIPCLICKHPDHTPEQMARDLGDRSRLSLAAPARKIVRAFEKQEMLMSEINRLWSQVDLRRWGWRLQDLPI